MPAFEPVIATLLANTDEFLASLDEARASMEELASIAVETGDATGVGLSSGTVAGVEGLVDELGAIGADAGAALRTGAVGAVVGLDADFGAAGDEAGTALRDGTIEAASSLEADLGEVGIDAGAALRAGIADGAAELEADMGEVGGVAGDALRTGITEAAASLTDELGTAGADAGAALRAGVVGSTAEIATDLGTTGTEAGAALTAAITEAGATLPVDLGTIGAESGAALQRETVAAASGLSAELGAVGAEAGTALRTGASDAIAALPSEMGAVGTESGAALRSGVSDTIGALPSEVGAIGTETGTALRTGLADSVASLPAEISAIGTETGAALQDSIDAAASGLPESLGAVSAEAGDAVKAALGSTGVEAGTTLRTDVSAATAGLVNDMSVLGADSGAALRTGIVESTSEIAPTLGALGVEAGTALRTGVAEGTAGLGAIVTASLTGADGAFVPLQDALHETSLTTTELTDTTDTLTVAQATAAARAALLADAESRLEAANTSLLGTVESINAGTLTGTEAVTAQTVALRAQADAQRAVATATTQNLAAQEALAGGEVEAGAAGFEANMAKTGIAGGRALQNGVADGSSGIKGLLSKLGVPESLLGGWAAAGVAMAGVGVIALDLGKKMQQADASIATSAGTSIKAATAIGNAMLNTAGESEFSGKEQAEAFAAVAGQLKSTQGQALNTAQAMQVMSAAGDLATAKQTSLASATSALASTMQSFQIKAQGAADVSNVLFNASNATGQSITAVSNALDKVKTRLGGMSPPLSQLSGLLVDLTDHGETGRAAMQALTTTFQAFLKPAAELATAQNNLNVATESLPSNLRSLAAQYQAGTLTGSQLTTVTDSLSSSQQALWSTFVSAANAADTASEAQKKMGITAVTANGQMAPLSSIIGQLQEKIKGMGTAQAIATLQSLGLGNASAKLVETIQAGPSAFNAATAAATKMGSAHNAAAIQSHTLGVEFKILEAAAVDWETELGGVLIPVLSDLIGTIAKVAIVASDVLKPAFDVVRDAITGTVGAITTVEHAFADVGRWFKEASVPAMVLGGVLTTVLAPAFALMAARATTALVKLAAEAVAQFRVMAANALTWVDDLAGQLVSSATAFTSWITGRSAGVAEFDAQNVEMTASQREVYESIVDETGASQAAWAEWVGAHGAGADAIVAQNDEIDASNTTTGGSFAAMGGAMGAIAPAAALAVGGLALWSWSSSQAAKENREFTAQVNAMTGATLGLADNTIPALNSKLNALIVQEQNLNKVFTEGKQTLADVVAYQQYQKAIQATSADLKTAYQNQDMLSNKLGISKANVEALATTLGVNLSTTTQSTSALVATFTNGLKAQATQAGTTSGALKGLAASSGTSTKAIAAAVSSAAAATQQGWSGMGDAITNFASATLPPTGKAIAAFYTQQEQEGSTFASNVQKAIAAGYNPQLISQILQAGPAQAGQFLQGLVNAQGSGLNKLVQQANSAIASEGTQAVEEARITQEAVSSKSSGMVSDLSQALAISQALTTANTSKSIDAVIAEYGGGLPAVERIAKEYGIALPTALQSQLDATAQAAQAQVTKASALSGKLGLNLDPSQLGQFTTALGQNGEAAQRDAAKISALSTEFDNYETNLKAKAAALVTANASQLSAMTSAANSAATATQQSWANVGDAVSNFASNKLPPTAGAIATFYTNQENLGKQFTNNIQKAIADGYNPQLISNIVQAGPAQAGKLLQGLVSAQGGALKSLVNSAMANLSSEGEQAVQEARLTARAVAAPTSAIAAQLPEALAISQALTTKNAGAAVAAVAKQYAGGAAMVETIAKNYGISLPNAINAELQPTKTAASKAADALPNALHGAVGPTKAAAAQLTGAISSDSSEGAVAALKGGLSIGEAYASGVATGISENIRIVQTAAGDAAYVAITSGGRTIRAQSPSREAYEKIGLPIPQGIALGISENQGLVIKASKQMMEATMAVTSQGPTAIARSFAAAGPQIVEQLRRIGQQSAEVLSSAFTIDQSSTVKGVTGTLTDLVSRYRDGYANFAQTANKYGLALPESLERGVEPTETAARAVGLAFTTGIASGISQSQGIIDNAAEAAAEGAIRSGALAIRAESPSQEAVERIGLPFDQGIAKGIADNQPLVVSSAERMMIATLQVTNQGAIAVGESFERIGPIAESGLRQIGQQTASELRSALTADTSAIVSGVNAMLQSVISAYRNDYPEIEALAKEYANALIVASAAEAGATRSAGAALGAAYASGIASGISSNTQVIITTAGGAAEAAIKSGASTIRAQSPSLEAAERIGLPYAQGIAAGIVTGQGTVSSAAQDLMSTATKSANTAATSGLSPLAAEYDDYITNLINNATKKSAAAAKAAASALASAGSTAAANAQQGFSGQGTGNAISFFASASVAPSTTAIAAFYKQQEQQAAQFTANIQKAMKDGYSPATISQLLAAGPAQAGELLQGLVNAHGSALKNLVNSTTDSITAQSNLAAEEARLAGEAVYKNSAQMSAQLSTALSLDEALTSKNAVGAVEAVAERLKGGYNTVAEIAREYGIALPNSLLNQIAKTQEAAAKQGQAFDDGMAWGIVGNENTITAAAFDAMGAAIRAAEDGLRSHSPSRETHDRLGQPFAEGFAEGILDNTHLAAFAAQTLVSQAMLAAQQQASKGGGLLGSLGNIGLPLAGGGIAAVAGGGGTGTTTTILNVTSPIQISGQTLAQIVTQYQIKSARSTGSVAGRYAGSSQTAAATSINTNAIQR